MESSARDVAIDRLLRLTDRRDAAAPGSPEWQALNVEVSAVQQILRAEESEAGLDETSVEGRSAAAPDAGRGVSFGVGRPRFGDADTLA